MEVLDAGGVHPSWYWGAILHATVCLFDFCSTTGSQTKGIPADFVESAVKMWRNPTLHRKTVPEGGAAYERLDVIAKLLGRRDIAQVSEPIDCSVS